MNKKILEKIYDKDLRVTEWKKDKNGNNIVRKLKPLEINVLIFLYVKCKNRLYTDSCKNIGAYCGACGVTIRRCMAILEKNGFIKTHLKTGHVNTYEIIESKLLSK